MIRLLVLSRSRYFICVTDIFRVSMFIKIFLEIFIVNKVTDVLVQSVLSTSSLGCTSYDHCIYLRDLLHLTCALPKHHKCHQSCPDFLPVYLVGYRLPLGRMEQNSSDSRPIIMIDKVTLFITGLIIVYKLTSDDPK